MIIIEDILERFIRNKTSVSLPLTLTQKKIYILPTIYGFLFMAVLLAMLMGSVNYNNNLGFLLTFLLGGMAFVSLLHTFRNLSGIQVSSVNTSPAFAGEKAVFGCMIRADNRKRPAVSFHFVGEPEILCDLLPDKDNRINIAAQTRKRGVFKPGTLMISSRYPLGLFQAWSRLPLMIETLVYPAPLPANLIFSGGVPSADGEGSQKGAGAEDFEGLRNYQPGDPPGHISWKTFSRGQGLFIKSFVGQGGSFMIIDWHSFQEKDTERKLSMLCNMVLKAHNLRIIYGLHLPGQRIEPSSGETHKHQCLRALALS
ncbi:MAG: hypothetical protein BWK80_16170 [Desulfobacteraceae bacterium IS3]|nr:MAG: hypothetical protein BWK80_16170 [Desulfobacteraceae bacterium IS3]HAO23420.1 DUF58 domain-containing protein [Desulfobacteraceae bacterium]